MDVRCERCETEYELEDSSVSEAGTQVQCTACGHTFLVTRGAVAPGAEAEPSPPPAEWLLETADGQFHRFRNLTSLQKWIIERKVTREDRISRTGHAWRRLGEIVELSPFFDVVDEADRARAAALSARALKAEADLARRSSSPRGVPALRRHSSGQQVLIGDGVPLVAPEVPTSVVRVRRGGGGKLLLVLLVAGGVAYVGITQYARLMPGAAPVASARPPPPPAPVPAPAPAPAPPPASPPAPSPVAEGPAPAPAAPEPPPAPAPTYEKLVAEADRSLENGATARAQKLYQQALKLKPAGAEALAGLGYAALDRGNTAQAFSLFRRALAQRPAFGPALFGLGEAHRAAGDEAEALDHYRRYVGVDPGGTDAPAARRHIKLLESRQAAKAAGAPGPP